jgi:L-lactate dehydrogenase complex protein LldG
VSERENILGRIREALRATAPFPGQHGDTAHPPPPTHTPTERAREWLPAVGDTWHDQLARFRANAADLKADFHCVADPAELAARLKEMRDRNGWKKIASHAGALTIPACQALALPICRTDPTYDRAELETCDAAITECDALIAQTGSVLVTSRSAGGRALSVLPPHHVILARREQLLRDLPAAFDLIQRKYGANPPSMISFITGPSRTSDIERILVLGAHGPKELTVLLVG